MTNLMITLYNITEQRRLHLHRGNPWNLSCYKNYWTHIRGAALYL